MNIDYYKKYCKYKSKYISLKNGMGQSGGSIGTIDLSEKYPRVICYLLIPYLEGDNGMTFVGTFTLINVSIELTAFGYTLKGTINRVILAQIIKDTMESNTKLKSLVDNVKNGQLFNSVEIAMNHIVFMMWDNVLIGTSPYDKIQINYEIGNDVDRYLQHKGYNNLKLYQQEKLIQMSMVYIEYYGGSCAADSTYKFHISCKIDKWQECYDKLLQYLNNAPTRHISRFKFPLTSLKHVTDYRNEDARKYFDWDGGTASANFVIYFRQSRNPYEHALEFLSDFIPYWTRDGFDESVARDINNLSFNERLTRSLFITYDTDTMTKTEFYEKNKNVSIYTPRELVDNKGTVLTMSDELRKEKDYGCKMALDEEKKQSFNECLKDKYNIDLSDLCHDKISKSHSWVASPKHAGINHTKSIESFSPRCYTQDTQVPQDTRDMKDPQNTQDTTVDSISLIPPMDLSKMGN